MPAELYAEILLPLRIKNTFTYKVPDEYANKLLIGSRVVVAVGKRKYYTGIVYRLHNQNKGEYQIKPIESVYDPKPIVNKMQMKLWEWIAEYYSCTLGEVFNAAVASIFIPDSESKISVTDNQTSANLTAKQKEVYNLIAAEKTLTVKDLSSKMGIQNPVNHLKVLQENGLINFFESVKSGYKPLVSKMVRFDVNVLKSKEGDIEKIAKRGIKQYSIIKTLGNIAVAEGKNQVEISELELLKQSSASKASLKTLAEKNIVELFTKEVSRIFENRSKTEHEISLTPAQQKCFKEIKAGFKKNKPVLLHGITSSGKTEIYIRLIQKALSENKTVLYLLPEIALTSQIIIRLREHFGDLIGIYHSKYSIAERGEVYNSVYDGKIKIVLGARSSIFMPFKNLGLVIVDEEHDASYKQVDPAPRYHARDTAVVLSIMHNANIVLGTATPSIESYYNTQIGKYSLVNLTERYGNINLPEIIPVDIKDGYKRKIMKSHFHPILIDYINQALDNKEQVILFQNRRGFSPYIQCFECGFIPICDSCNVSLTYHKFRNKMICHYCGKNFNLFDNCPKCGGNKMLTKGMGTEQLEDEVNAFFPEAVVKRLDYDTAKTRRSYENIISEFSLSKIDILIGTQMVSKGLDFENVSLVGILNADNLLGFPDYRAFERSFQMFSQVSGRAGRRSKRGKVIIQSFDTKHMVIEKLCNNDYIGLYNNQIHERKLFKYPPFSYFIIVKLKHRNVVTLNKAAKLLANNLRIDLYDRVKGPEEPLINRIKNAYIKNIHIRYEKEVSPKKLKAAIMQKCDALKMVSEFSSINIQIDVDPL